MAKEETPQEEKKAPKKDGPIVVLKPKYLKMAQEGARITPGQKFTSYDGVLKGKPNGEKVSLASFVTYPLYYGKMFGLLRTHFDGDIDEAEKLTLSEAVKLDMSRKK